MSKNEKWSVASKQDLEKRNSAIIKSLNQGDSLGKIAVRFGLSRARIAKIREAHIKEQERLNSDDFIDRFTTVRVRNCLRNIGVKTLDDLVEISTIEGGVWTDYYFFGKARGVPNFGRASYKEMMRDLFENSSDEEVNRIKQLGATKDAYGSAKVAKEKREYERLRAKYGPEEIAEEKKEYERLKAKYG